jgi:hypothetical protein
VRQQLQRMVARPISGEVSQESYSDASREARRKELRYRFAGMLAGEKFGEALDEAVLARRKDEILPADFEFVANIVKAAARMGRVKIEPQRYPIEPTRPSIAKPGSLDALPA